MAKLSVRFIFLLLALWFSTPADATKLFIREYASLATQKQGNNPQVAQEPGLVDQAIDFTGGATLSAAFSSSTRFVRLWCDVQCSVRFGGSAATNANAPLTAGSAEYFGVVAGDKVSVITNP